MKLVKGIIIVRGTSAQTVASIMSKVIGSKGDATKPQE